MGVKFNPFSSTLDVVDSPSGDFSDVELNQGTAAAPSISFNGDPNTGIYSPGADQVAISTNGTGRLFVDANGDVGVGTASLGNKFEVAGNALLRANGQLKLGDATNQQVSIIQNSGAANTSQIEFLTGSTPTERLRITSDGKLGLGTSSPNAGRLVITSSSDGGIGGSIVLENSNNSDTDKVGIALRPNGSATTAIGSYGEARIISEYVSGSTNGANNLQFWTHSGDGTVAQALHIDSSQRVGIGTTSPSTTLEVIGDAKIGTTSYPIRFATGASTGVIEYPATSSRSVIRTLGATPLEFEINSSPVARFDTSGRLLVGTSSARSNFAGNTAAPLVQIEGVTASTASFSVARGVADAIGPTFNLGKTRGASVGQNTVVASGDQCGVITFQGADGTNLIRAAQIEAEVDGTPGDNNMPGRLVFSTTADGASSPTGRMTIKSNGNVGIGTSTPGELLHLRAGSFSNTDSNSINNLIRITDLNSRYNGLETFLGNFKSGIRFDATQLNGALVYGSFIQQVVTSNNFSGSPTKMRASLIFGTRGDAQTTPSDAPVERLRITDAGRVGIGTTNPSASLHVAGTGAIIRVDDGERIDLIPGANANDPSLIVSSNGSALTFASNGATEMARLDTSGRFLVGRSSAPTAGQGQYALVVAQGYVGNATGLGVLSIQRGTAATSLAVDSDIGRFTFNDIDGNTFAQIECEVDATTGSGDYPGRLVFSTTPDGDSSPDEVMRITSDKYVRLASGTGGIQFNGDTAAANALDDYEEGTWTPTLVPETGAFTSITYDSTRVGYYTKVGNLVTVWGRMRTDSVDATGASGLLSIGGLPFTVGTGTNGGGFAVTLLNWAGEYPSAVRPSVGNSFAYLSYRSAIDGSDTISDVSDLTTGTADANRVSFQFSYRV